MTRTSTRLSAIIVVLASQLVAFDPASAQVATDTEARISAAKDLLNAMGADQQFKVAIDTMTSGLGEAIKRQNPDKAQEIEAVLAAIRTKFSARIDDIKSMTACLWAEKLTVADLKDIATFYASPVGRKLLAAQPEIMQKSMQAGLAWGAKIAKELQDETRDELKKRGINL